MDREVFELVLLRRPATAPELPREIQIPDLARQRAGWPLMARYCPRGDIVFGNPHSQ